MKNIYPELKNLFADTRAQRKAGGRPLSYLPEEIENKFEEYVSDLRAHPIEIETQYKRQSRKEGAFMDKEERQQQNRVETLPVAPRVSDFVNRWLGKDMSWWTNLSNADYHPNKAEEFLTIKNKIQNYCRNVKLNGACVGIYNPVIIARELGLTDKQQVEQNSTQVVVQVQNADEAKRLHELANMK